jgi:murein DD-endopeptidase MepM/ murein hydrolase activator NlpD
VRTRLVAAVAAAAVLTPAAVATAGPSLESRQAGPASAVGPATEDDFELPDVTPTPKPKPDPDEEPEDEPDDEPELPDPDDTPDREKPDKDDKEPEEPPGTIKEPVEAEPAAPETSAADAAAAAEAAEHADALAELSAAIQSAQAALVDARSRLADAQDRLASAERNLGDAQAAHAAAQAELEAAELAEAQAERSVSSTTTAVSGQQLALGTLAREAYQGGGPLASLSVVLDATTPAEFAGRLMSMDALLRSEDAAIARLAAQLADLRESENRLGAARAMREELEAEAARLVLLMRSARDAARLVQDEAERAVDARSRALNAVEAARADEIDRYRQFLATSQALSTSVVGWSADLAGTGSTVQGTGTWARPGYGTLTSPFGQRFHPILKIVKLHTGADYSAGDGIVYAADRGAVLVAGYNSAYGNMVVLGHGRQNGQWVATLYAHLASIRVKTGDVVGKAAMLGLVGSTGYSTGPHLHFEIRYDGIPVDPEPLLAGAPDPDDVRLARISR